MGDRELRRVFIVTGILAMAWDLFYFVMPIYGTSIGLSASTIGGILGSFAAATFAVRMVLPWFARRLPEWRLVTFTLFVACVAYALFPLVRTVPLIAAIAFLLGPRARRLAAEHDVAHPALDAARAASARRSAFAPR